MKYLRPKRKGVKIRVAPSKEITVLMYLVVRVEENYDVLDQITDGNVTVMSMTGKEMIYQYDKGKMWTKRKYIKDILDSKRDFHITDDFNFINL